MKASQHDQPKLTLGLPKIPPGIDVYDEQDYWQIRSRLEWTPEERLDRLTDMIAFEKLAHSARRIAAP